MTTDIVIAWYNEDINWINTDENIKNNSKVYCKNNENRIKPYGIEYIKLPNVGRESHTYILHIIEHYDNLADTTFFLQGKCTDHCANYLELIKENFNNRTPGFTPLGHWKLLLSKDFNCKYWDEKGRKLTEKIYHELFGDNLPATDIAFTAGALFFVSKDAIKRRSIEFWRKCLSYVDYHICPDEGYVLERLWNVIFSDIPSLL